MNEIEFAVWLHDEMVKRKWSKDELAERSGLTPQIIRYYLHGERLPTLRTFSLILKALGMRMSFVNE